MSWDGTIPDTAPRVGAPGGWAIAGAWDDEPAAAGDRAAPAADPACDEAPDQEASA